MQLCFFQTKSSNELRPLTLTRPVDDLRIGILTIREKWINQLKPQHVFRDDSFSHAGVFDEKSPDESTPKIWINAQYLPDSTLTGLIKELKPGECITAGDDLIAAHTISNRNLNSNNLDSTEYTDATKITFLWDLLTSNAKEIESDIHLLGLNVITHGISDIILSSPNNIFIDKSATIEPGAIIIADKGPVYIGENATIEAGAIIKGPVAVCNSATIKMAARVSDGTTIGPWCKAGGEISNSIMHSYSNKGHDGYMGNSIIGQWCNLGADTNTSNLKNNYSKVRLAQWDSGVPYNEGVQFLGTVMGDHSKTAINTMLNTGTICGVCSNIFTSGFPPKYIPSFSWLGDQGRDLYKLGKAFEAMEAMMARRNITMTENYKSMITDLYNSSKS